ncbi:copper amine oxidase N-terminal domain-containing protein [Paenibacillus dakarensis]|uniref:copper amine oxidase N-terminal domain-containing protein n=1 Tax=Paenibacillus dakarensis TaxID=1527293 RepID=UPI0006D54172|nr:copper amine oxidase N-terminal domain-containing protein [Paenibacillus dakarensis]
MKKKLALSGLITATAASLMFNPTSSAAESTQQSVQFQMDQLSYSVESDKHLLETAPFELHSHSMVPLREMALSLGSQVTWNQTDQSITLSGRSFRDITLTIDSNIAVNAHGEQIQLPEHVRLVNGRVFVPARSVALLMNAKLVWEPGSRTVTVSQHLDSADPIYINYDFNKDEQGWKGGFSELPVDYNPDTYELKHTRELIPLPEQQEPKYGLKLSGINQNGDLFMFLSRGVGGLKPNTDYDVKMNFAMYTDQKAGSDGVGVAPAESVFVKAGIVNKEPQALTVKDAENLYYRMNLDIGYQSSNGENATVIGDIRKPDPGKEGFQRVDFDYSATVTTDAQGKIYLLIGTHSGFEGLSTLYYSDIQVTATPK